jgi:hypothetical protein
MLLSLQETAKSIESGRRLAIAGDESLLSKLPRGNWIGGTTPYFMLEDGCTVSKDKLFIHDLTDATTGASIKSYGVEDLPKISEDALEQGFSIVIVPAFSSAHVAYGRDASNYPDIFDKSILGWISGTHLGDFGKVTPKVFNGATGESSDKDAIAIHCQIEAGKTAIVEIINLFEQGSGETITFEEEGFHVKNCIVNDSKCNFAEYLNRNNIDTKLPLVADYCGAMVNSSFMSVDEKEGVKLYAPVLQGVEYKIAAPISSYIENFHKALPKDTSPVFACNCILNFLYSELEGRVVEKMSGPITFGEIAYQLVNQTLVYLEIK